MREHCPERKRDMDVAHVTFADEPEGSYRGRRAEVPQGVLEARKQALVTGIQQLTLLRKVGPLMCDPLQFRGGNCQTHGGEASRLLLHTLDIFII